MTALTFSATLTDADKTVFSKSTAGDADNTYEMSTWLYADSAFDTWLTAINKSGYVKTEDEKTFADAYSSYTLAIKCDVTKIGGKDKSLTSRAGLGCCLRDESQKGGGYCMFRSDDGLKVNSFFLTDAQFITVLQSNEPSTISAPTN